MRPSQRVGRAVLATTAAGQVISVSLARGSAERTVQLTLGELPGA